MPIFPINDPAREDDIRVRRRRAGLLLAGIVIVPWVLFHHDHHDAGHHVIVSTDNVVSIDGDDVPRGGLSGVLTNLPMLGRLRWSITGDALPQPSPGAPIRSFSADRLTVDLTCASSVTLLPKQDLGDEVTVSVRPDQRSAMQALTVKDGVVEQQEACSDDQKADFILQLAPGKALTIEQEGDVDIRGGRFSGTVKIEASGSGDVTLEGTGSLIDNQHASGDVAIGEVSGNVVSTLLGSGGLKVDGGDVAHLSIESRESGDVSMGQTVLNDSIIRLNGSGGFTADRVVGRLDARTLASGDITIASVSTDIVRLQGDGSGDIAIRGGRIETLTASRGGSGDLDVRAIIGNGKVAHGGSGDVTLPHVSGTLVRTRLQNEDDEDN